MPQWQPNKTASKLRRQIETMVARFGWAIQGVFADPAAGQPTFSYTVGLYRTHGHPEIVIFGVPPETAKTILNQVAGRFAKDGESIVPGARYDQILEEFPLVFIEAQGDRVVDWLFIYDWFYRGQTPPVLQLVWPDTAGRFPWEDGFDHRFAAAQPLLGPPARSH